ncbi:Sialic acid synthase [Bagarius yarrelli]|uniref:Sialic acid synthase n=1 Tax=Bagarius yarrelli TaxID=175774 RepID=A0A556U8A8_BAGYA|nr:Sialic acid synthase [Bagarius yarrelli]
MPLEFELCPGRVIGGNQPCFIIAEIGQNHQGDLEIAKKMIKMVKDCGADCAKFQKSELEYKFNKRALERPYTSKHSWGKTYGEHKRHLEFTHEQYRELQSYAREIGIYFTASGMDEMAVEFLHELKVPFFKVGSGDTNNFPYLEKTAKKGQECEILYEILNADYTKSVKYLPSGNYTPSGNNNDDNEYQKEFPEIPIGYSGHEMGISISLAAVAMGAKVLERHVTLDKSWKGTDHSASLDPSELAELVRSIRIVERALGNGVKSMLPSEVPCHDKLGKSVVAKTAIPKGTELTLDMLAVKVAEPKGVAPEDIFELVGKKTLLDIGEDESITVDAVENHVKRAKVFLSSVLVDMDDFDMLSSPQNNAGNGVGGEEEDPAAAFLAQQESEIAGIENDEGFSILDGGEIPQSLTDSIGNGGDSIQDFLLFECAEARQKDMSTNGPSDVYAAISSVDRMQTEPESLRKWREEQCERLQVLDENSRQQEVEWKEKAKQELEEWHARQDEQLAKTKVNNRVLDEDFYKQPFAHLIGYVAAEDVIRSEADDSSPGTEWERVARLCDFNPKSSKQAKDVSRMRSVLISLKQTPLVR